MVSAHSSVNEHTFLHEIAKTVLHDILVSLVDQICMIRYGQSSLEILEIFYTLGM